MYLRPVSCHALCPAPYVREPVSRFCSTDGLALTADIDYANRTLRADGDMLIELAVEIRERYSREAENKDARWSSQATLFVTPDPG